VSSPAYFDWSVDDDRVLTLTMNDPNSRANTMNEEFVGALPPLLDRLEAERDSYAGVVLTSAKDTFFAGADLDMLMTAGPAQAGFVTNLLDTCKAAFRRLETLGRPVVAALGGTALGGGFEIALACHRRIAVDDPAVRFGLPEVTLGLLPGAGGVTRIVRMFGIQRGLKDILLTGRKFTPAEALTAGVVDDVVADPAAMLAIAKEWILANPDAHQPWDADGYRIPGGTPSTPALAAMLPAVGATVRKQGKGAPYPAPRSIAAAAVEGAQVDLETASRIETTYVTELICGQVSTNMIKAMFWDLQHVKRGAARPVDVPVRAVEHVTVVGAGMMGAGIAYSCAAAGLTVTLHDLNLDAAVRGKGYSRRLLDAAVRRGRRTPAERDAILARITPGTDLAAAARSDLVVEAVFEDPQLKRSVFAEVGAAVGPDTILASNTSTLPITQLAAAVPRPEDFIGLHFFSPVDKMELLEIVVGEKTSTTTLAHAVDFARRIGKVPIVVNDSRGFFTSRVIGRFLDEAVAMVGEGIPAATVEQAATQAGYPVGALALMDELTLTLPRRIREETRRGVEAAGGTWVSHPAEAVVDRLIDEFGRTGRSDGKGFYDYDGTNGGRRTRLWPGLAATFGSVPTTLPLTELGERMLFAESLDAVRCLEEGVLRSVEEANVGSILGIGFPAWTGGVIQYVNQYTGGPAGFARRAEELARRHGDRFQPPQTLLEAAGAGTPIA
jgi:3-hydroxyacyl-CoA dehydrogenase/enoyl-CoA hydratase/3-hydroxybutyryl-CoA epimerase